MGANEKVAATFHGYTPSTERVRISWVRDSVNAFKGERSQAESQFDRWLEQVRAEAKAEALTEAADAINRLDSDVEMYDENLNATQVTDWLRTRAKQIRGAQ